MSLHAVLLALQHADSAFPSGGFAFSQGLEAWSRLEGGGRVPPARLQAFIGQQVRQRWACADKVAVALAHRAGSDAGRVAEVDAEVEAATLNARFREASRRNGAALLASHERLATPGAAGYRRLVAQGLAIGHLAPAQGLLWSALGLEEEAALAMSGYAFLAGLSSAAVRLNLTGAITAQAMLRDLLPAVAEAVAQPVPADAMMTTFTPLTEIAIMQDGEDGARLFSS